ncbi:MAG TPA: hypothetical protein PLP21_10870 [Pyrinomonadaceae bacterium]|nr:hypothetical protein [Pyrinomonadaceae bacterium]
MAGEYDSKLDQLTGLVETLTKKVDRSIGGLDELRLEMRGLRTEVNGHTSRFDRIDSQIAVVSGRQGDIISKVIDIRKELTATSASINDQSVKILEMWNRLVDIQGTF